MCVVDQKRSFFPRVGPFLDVLPFKGPFPLTGALTGRLPYGKVPYGEVSYGKAPYGEASYGETPLITRKLTGRLPLREAPYEEGRSLREGSFTEKDDEEDYGKAGPLQEAPYEEGRSLREGPVPYGKGRGPLQVLRREGRRRGSREGRALTRSP